MDKKLGQEPAFGFEYSSFEGNPPCRTRIYHHSMGMSKRFYAACAAMQGILSANPKDTWGNIDLPVPQYIAELSYSFADEILKQEEIQTK